MQNPHNTYFAVTTPGLSATRWISFVLASNQDAFVTHGKHPLHSIQNGSLVREQQMGDEESITDGNKMKWFYENLSLSEMHQIFESIRPDAKALGTVHSFTIESLSKKIGENTEDFRINVSNVLRHPVNYINSHFNLVKSAEGHQLYEHYERDLFNKALTLFPELLLIDCDNYSDFLAFTVSCLSVHNLIYDLNASDIPHYRMEDLTTNTDLLKSFCEKTTGLPYQASVLNQMIQGGAINTHKKDKNKKTPIDIFEGWKPWQKDMCKIMIPLEVVEMFEKNGYQMDMLDISISKPTYSEANHNFAPGTSLADYLSEQHRAHYGLQLITD